MRDAERRAPGEGGLRFNRFHTTALCAPTRAALLTGRNHHTVGMGCVTEVATSAPGYSSVRPKSCAPVAEILKLNGYSTAQFGKCHEVPQWQTSPMGPFDAWLTLRGVRMPAGATITMLGVDGALAWRSVGADVEITLPKLAPDNAPCRYAYVIKLPGSEVRGEQ